MTDCGKVWTGDEVVPYEKPKGFHEMPYELLAHLYSFLPLEEVVKMQYISHRYARATQDATVWKRVPFLVSDDDYITDVIKDLTRMPYLHTIYGYYCDKEVLINALVANQVDLREMDVKFSTPISSAEIEKLLKKFKHLESITVDCCNSFDILNSLRHLSYCQTLKELKIFNTKHNPDVYRVIAAGFPALEKLEINGFSPCREILDMFDRKRNQLKSIMFNDENSKVTSDIMESVFACSELQTLKLRGVRSSMNSPEFQNLRFLKYLSVTVGHVLGAFSHVVFPPSIETLSVNCWDFSPLYVGVTEKVIDQISNLKHFELANIPDKDIDIQLNGIGSLQKLETLVFLNCTYLTERSVESISKCLNLKRLCIDSVTISRESLLLLRHCIEMKQIVFFNCKLKLEGLEFLILPLKWLTDFYLYCCYEDTDQYCIGFRHLRDVIEKCKSVHHSVNLTCNFPVERFIT